MIDIGKQIAYWLNSAREDWDAAQELVRSGRVRHGLFFAHLALEKALKAQVSAHTRSRSANPQSGATDRIGRTPDDSRADRCAG